VKIVKNVQPLAGLTRFLFRMPIYLYRLKLGWLFGSRLLLLNHVGRVSGKSRLTILEVAELMATATSSPRGGDPTPRGIATFCTPLPPPSKWGRGRCL
jgi:hypothetical protein